MTNAVRLAGQDVTAMPNITFASDYRPASFTPPSQLAQFGPAAEAMFHEICSGDNPIVPRNKQRAFIGAVLDEIGRGTHPSELRDRLMKRLDEQPEVPRAA